MRKEQLPIEFKPYAKLTICSNELFDGAQLMRLGEEFPLVIGSGSKRQPLLWVAAIADKQATKIIEVISSSVSAHPFIRVELKKNEITAFLGQKEIIHVEVSDNQATVDFLDLRLLGFEIYGDKKKLTAAGAEMSDNKFYGSVAMIDLMPLPSHIKSPS